MRMALIDDNRTVVKFLELMFKKHNFVLENDEFDTFLSISSFFEKYGEEFTNLDLISCDYDLGKESPNGLFFLNHIIKSGFKGTCVLLTGDDTFLLRNEVAMYPEIHYVIKTASCQFESSTFSQLGKIIDETRKK